MSCGKVKLSQILFVEDVLSRGRTDKTCLDPVINTYGCMIRISFQQIQKNTCFY